MKASAQRRFDEHQRCLTAYEPDLRLTLDETQRIAVIRGAIVVPVGAGIRRQYMVEIEYQDMSPFRLPTTRETTGEIPWEIDRHISPVDGTFCMWLPQTAPRDFDTTEGLLLHLDRVREFLLLQILYDDNLRRGRMPAWEGPEWNHGTAGHRQWTREQIEGLDARAIGGLYGAVVKAPHPGSRCPCRSGRSVRDCHARWLSRMRHASKISEHVLSEVAVAWEERRADQDT